jgi:hypothetical protein
VTVNDALARMRCTAALLGCSTDLSARLVHDDVIIVEVMRPPFPVREHAVLPPCWFRCLVADGLREPAAGTVTRERIDRLVACRIDLGFRNGATLRPGEVVRVDAGGSWMHLHAVAAPVVDVEPVVSEAVDELWSGADDIPLELHAAHDLDVTVLGQATDATPAASDAAADLLRTIAMRVAIRRLERDLACIAEHPARRVSSPRPHPDEDGR